MIKDKINIYRDTNEIVEKTHFTKQKAYEY